ncbi:FecR family protein [Aquimarina algiphila]|uniref:FecR family protein n=1 Tax=Aquimarina algiphila TaxID=2047982 RepID=UPI00232CAF9C|nr:FecR family protein [Aquimarina algiphila]
MKNNKDLDTNQIIKYLNNEMTESEIIELETLLKDEKNLNLFKKYIVTDHYIQLSKNDFDSQKASSLFQKHIQNTKSLTKTNKNRNNNYLKYAAVFIGLILGGTFLYNKNISNENEIITEVTLQQGDGSIETLQDNELFKEIKNEDGTILAFQEKNKIVYNNEGNNATSEEKVVINTLRVPYGKKIQLVLSDGTTVHVNAGSTLKFPSKFLSGQIREVDLSGEAYFEVARNEKDPFIVSTNGIRTEVLGTKFNVSSYADDSFSEVVLVEGSVGVFKDKNRFDKNTDKILSPNQKASLSKTSQSLNISNVKTENYIAWVDGILLFKSESFETVMKKLERFYDKKITINYQNIKTEKFTGRFDVENVEDVLKTFKSNTFFNYRIKGNEIIINP